MQAAPAHTQAHTAVQVLLVEDDPAIADTVVYALRREA